jgi:hypothetical protein
MLLGGVLAVLLGVALVAPAPAQDPALRRFVDGIYANYRTPDSPGTRINSRAMLERYFTPSLAALIDADARAAKRRNEPPVLNGDPFIDAQDWDINGLAIELREQADRANATVRFSSFGEAREVRLDLLKTAAGWRIDEIHWRDGSLRGLYRKN